MCLSLIDGKIPFCCRTVIETRDISSLIEKAAAKWWFFAFLVLLFFIIPSYTQSGAGYQESQNVIKEVLTNPLIYQFSPLLWASKAAIVLLILLLAFQGRKMARPFAVVIALFYLGIAVFQNTALTSSYGQVILTGNVVLMLLVAAFWIAEALSPVDEFTPPSVPPWKWWVVPFAALAFWFPVDPSGTTPQFTLTNLVSNGSMLTYCMFTPILLATLTIYYPHVNRPTMRVTSYVGIMFGMINVVEWFVLQPSMWWMGVMHVPLITISVVAFAMTLRGKYPVGIQPRISGHTTYPGP